MQQVLQSTNAIRTSHQAAAYKWDAALATSAGEYAAYLAKQKKCSLIHDRASSDGENLFASFAYPTAKTACLPAITSWAAEEKDYRFSAKRPFGDNWSSGQGRQVGHFTQLVWRATRRMGCGRATGAWTMVSTGWHGQCNVVVCRYQPAGNIASDAAFAANVRPPKAKAKKK